MIIVDTHVHTSPTWYESVENYTSIKYLRASNVDAEDF
jgi:hypothetical protein